VCGSYSLPLLICPPRGDTRGNGQRQVCVCVCVYAYFQYVWQGEPGIVLAVHPSPACCGDRWRALDVECVEQRHSPPLCHLPSVTCDLSHKPEPFQRVIKCRLWTRFAGVSTETAGAKHRVWRKAVLRLIWGTYTSLNKCNINVFNRCSPVSFQLFYTISLTDLYRLWWPLFAGMDVFFTLFWAVKDKLTPPLHKVNIKLIFAQWSLKRYLWM